MPMSVHQMKAALLFPSAVMLVPFDGDEPLLVKHVDGDDPVILIVRESNGDERCVSWEHVCKNYEMVIV